MRIIKMETIFDLKSIEDKVIEHLKKVYDPEIPANVFDLGLIYNIEFEQEKELAILVKKKSY